MVRIILFTFTSLLFLIQLSCNRKNDFYLTQSQQPKQPSVNYPLLDDRQKTVIDQNKHVLINEIESTSPWPRSTYYRYFAAVTPLEICAVFWDFNIQKDYIKDLSKSSISKKIAKNILEVDYTAKVPVIADENYTVRDSAYADLVKSIYQIHWTLVKATRTIHSEGYFQCEPLKNGTFVTYHSFVTPGGMPSWVSSRLKNLALQKVVDVPNSVVKQTFQEKRNNTDKLQAQIARFKAIFQ